MTTEIANVTRFSSGTLKGMCGPVKSDETVSCGGVSLSLSKAGRQPTKEKVANEDQRKDALG